MKTLKSFTRIAAIVIFSLTAASFASGQKLASEDLDSLIANAQTKEDHLKLAAHFSARAEELAQDSKRHEAMARRYQGENLPSKVISRHRSMARHCTNLARSLSEASKEARQLADDHRAMAEQAEQ
jgi:hypothetical protein